VGGEIMDSKLLELFKKAKYISIDKSRADADLKDYVICGKCEKKIPADKYIGMQKVCQFCGFHARLPARERVAYITDADTFEEKYNNLQTVNPIEYDGYLERITELQKLTGLDEAVLTGFAKIGGIPVGLGVMDSSFLIASMGSVVGEKITRLFEEAAERSLPVIMFTASGGARMHEGIISLMQMAKVSAAVGRHSDAGLLYMTVVTDPTTGGVTASFASLGDIILAEPGALLGFTGRRVIEGTIGKKLPPEFQTAEFMLSKGFVDKIVPRAELKNMLASLLKLHIADITNITDVIGEGI